MNSRVLAASEPPTQIALIALVASSSALAAAGIDVILPALPEIGRQMQIEVENHRQWIISSYFLGLGLGQLVFGTLSDALGRKRVLVTGVASYVVLSVAAALARDFTELLIARTLQGFSIAAASVVTRSIVRDLHAGPRMAKVLSVAFAVFLVVPIAGPALGQVLLRLLPWRGLLSILAVAAALHAVIVGRYWPETLAPSQRRRPDLRQLRSLTVHVLTEPQSVFYSLASALLGAWMLAYVGMMPQIFEHVFRRPEWMAGTLAVCASAMAAGSLVSASLVERFGPKCIATLALVGFIAAAIAHRVWIGLAHETVLSFMALQSLTLAAMGLAMSNLSASAMEHMGGVAGTAASLQGFITMAGSAVLSAVIGAGFRDDAGWVPLSAFFCGSLGLALVTIAGSAALRRVLFR